MAAEFNTYMSIHLTLAMIRSSDMRKKISWSVSWEYIVSILCQWYLPSEHSRTWLIMVIWAWYQRPVWLYIGIALDRPSVPSIGRTQIKMTAVNSEGQPFAIRTAACIASKIFIFVAQFRYLCAFQGRLTVGRLMASHVSAIRCDRLYHCWLWTCTADCSVAHVSAITCP